MVLELMIQPEKRVGENLSARRQQRALFMHCFVCLIEDIKKQCKAWQCFVFVFFGRDESNARVVLKTVEASRWGITSYISAG